MQQVHSLIAERLGFGKLIVRQSRLENKTYLRWRPEPTVSCLVVIDAYEYETDDFRTLLDKKLATLRDQYRRQGGAVRKTQPPREFIEGEAFEPRKQLPAPEKEP